MSALLRSLLFCSLAVTMGSARAADCHDILGTWDFTLQCVANDVGSGPHSGVRNITGEVTFQDECVFHGTLGGYSWVGALHGDHNRMVSSDYGAAKATGELANKRRGSFREMSLTYTFSDFSIPSGGPQTACTGVGIRR